MKELTISEKQKMTHSQREEMQLKNLKIELEELEK